MGDTAVDFFVSYTSADHPWAQWVSAELEQAGYSTIVQARDMPAGSNFMLEMDDAAAQARRMIAVLSPGTRAAGHRRRTDPC